MLRDRQRSNRRICRIDFSAFTAFLVALATLLVWAKPAGFHDGTPITLPSTASAIALWRARREDTLQVAIPRDGKIFFDRQQIRPAELLPRLRERIRAGAPRKVYIRADARARYRTVMAVLDVVRSAGLSDVAFITHRPSGTLVLRKNFSLSRSTSATLMIPRTMDHGTQQCLDSVNLWQPYCWSRWRRPARTTGPSPLSVKTH